MLEGLYSAAAGMNAQQQRLDAIANDVANVSTAGYKRLRVGFRDLVYQEAGAGARAGVTTGNGVAVDLIGRSLAQGALRRTERSLDVSISGGGYLQVRTPDGRVALTRDGNLHAGPDGRLRTSSGATLEPPVTIPADVAESDITIAPDGAVSAAGRPAGRISIVNVGAPSGLISVGDNLFLPTAASGATAAAAGSRLEQGSLESSNVDIADSMVDMIDAQRALQLASRAVQIQDQVLEVANGLKR